MRGPDEVTVDGVRYVRAFPIVAEHACPHCGTQKQVWDASSIVMAIEDWAAMNGRAPTEREWYAATPEHPCDTTVIRMFGWAPAMRLAGFEPWRPGRSPLKRARWTRETVAGAIVEWTVVNGRAPRCSDWRASGGLAYPSNTTVKKLFGSWNAGLEAAGVLGARPPVGGRRRFRKRLQPARGPASGARRLMLARPVAVEVGRWLERTGLALEVAAERAEVPERRLRSILNGEQENVEVGTADRILTAIGSLAWWEDGELARVYEGEAA